MIALPPKFAATISDKDVREPTIVRNVRTRDAFDSVALLLCSTDVGFMPPESSPRFLWSAAHVIFLEILEIIVSSSVGHAPRPSPNWNFKCDVRRVPYDARSTLHQRINETPKLTTFAEVTG